MIQGNNIKDNKVFIKGNPLYTIKTSILMCIRVIPYHGFLKLTTMTKIRKSHYRVQANYLHHLHTFIMSFKRFDTH